MPTEREVLVFASIGGFIGAIFSALLPSIPTTYWMWKERPNYRAILVGAWILALFVFIAVLYWVREK